MQFDNNHSSLPIHVISLPQETQRRARMQDQLARLNLPFTFFDAIDGRTLPPGQPLPYDEKRRLRIFGKPLTPGEIGCLLSHKAVLEQIAQSDARLALVLEDDVIVGPALPELLKELAARAGAFDLVRFLAGPKIDRLKKRKILGLGTGHLYRLLPLSCGAYAYVITPRGAQKLLAALPGSAFPIDMLMARTWETGLEALILHPSPVAHDGHFGSSIEEGRYEKKTWRGLHRTAFKIAESVQKQWQYYVR